MKMPNKKGAIIFSPLLVVFMVIGFLIAWSAIMGKYGAFDRKIGEKQFELINTYQEGEKAMFYIDQSAKYSSYQAIYDLGKSGGCISGEIHDGYRVWTINSPRQGICFPSTQDSKNGFFDFFSNNLNGYLSEYSPLGLPLNNYELSFDGTTLIGTAKEPLNVPIIKDKSNGNLGTYSIKAPFKVDIGNYDFIDYEALRLKSQEYIGACDNRAPLICVDEKKSEIFDAGNFRLGCPNAPETAFLDYIWDSDVRSSIYGLCVESNDNRIYAYEPDDGNVDLRNIEYRFALQFQDLECTLEDHPDLINTKCMEFSCDAYASCKDATPQCYCKQGEGNECQGACLPFCSEVGAVSNPVIDQDPATKCTEFLCNNYLSCSSATDTCGCQTPSNIEYTNACGGLDCSTLHCARDAGFESKKGVKTECRPEACSYYDRSGGHSCAPTDSCQCDFVSNACEGDCTFIEAYNNIACGCGDNDLIAVTFPYGCGRDSYTECEGGCNPSCDACGCEYNECGGCANEECPEEEEDTTPEPVDSAAKQEAFDDLVDMIGDAVADGNIDHDEWAAIDDAYDEYNEMT